MEGKLQNNSAVQKFSNFCGKVGNEVHLRSLRDAFAMIMPLFILAGIGTLINSVIFPWLFKGQTLANLQVWGTLISNGTLNIAGLALAPATGFTLAKNKNYKNPMAAAIISLAALIMMMPQKVSLTLATNAKPVDVTGGLSYANLGTSSMFSGIIVGLLATELFIWLGSIKKLKINLGDKVPPMVGESFNSMIPSILTASAFALVGALLAVFGQTDLISLIVKLIQEPLRSFNTSLPGSLFIYSIGNFLFTLGIHQTVVNGTLLDPVLLINMNKNMAAYNAHKAVPYIMNKTFLDTFGMIGGSGSTICLIIAVFLVAKQKSSKTVAGLSLVPGLFNINEPMIFGFPIVFNIPLMIPFVLQPVIGLLIAYFFTAIGWMSRVVVYIPWVTPPVLSAFLATGGDWRAIFVHLLIIVIGVLFYMPFVKISERVSAQNAAVEN
ncbi:PTS transporter subunit EIIC [Lactobacillus sp. ESL0681]|uniref:PTS sugar transporter subunit IIC n=1 Tax=Lactobacillus sp. ESL0681 TaxID=2983211 RepID=UPI0023F85648|nr:PTS transporter subunit EIIC [Lactobacillus sp. ESL0681]WEV39864.1 PTS transporter subunit EIIC [Lactobacillus sp. ESL0681]